MANIERSLSTRVASQILKINRDSRTPADFAATISASVGLYNLDPIISRKLLKLINYIPDRERYEENLNGIEKLKNTLEK